MQPHTSRFCKLLVVPALGAAAGEGDCIQRPAVRAGDIGPAARFPSHSFPQAGVLVFNHALRLSSKARCFVSDSCAVSSAHIVRAGSFLRMGNPTIVAKRIVQSGLRQRLLM